MINIYIIHNTINNKKYIGQTSKIINARFYRHCHDGERSMPISHAIKKYGKESFYIELIETVDSLEKANEMEVFWANHYNSFCPNGYNLKAGGRLYSALSEEVKNKISIGNKGRKATPETIQKLRESHLGHIPTAETRKKLSDHFKGKTPHINTAIGASLKNSKKYKFMNPQGEIIEIENLRQFCLKNNLGIPSMCSVATGKKEQYKGWRIVN